MKGKIKSFNRIRGYGFIVREELDDIFFHFSSLNMEGYKTIRSDTEVSFDLENGEKGLRAINIEIIK